MTPWRQRVPMLLNPPPFTDIMLDRLLTRLVRLRHRWAERHNGAKLVVDLLEEDSPYVSHGRVFLHSVAEQRDVEYEFKLNRPEFLHSPNEHVLKAIAEQLVDRGYLLRHLVSHQPPGWH
jgi:hypothetical protein